MSDLVERFIKLFRGRGDVYGGWDGFMVKEPLTPQLFERHLQGTEGIGVYPQFDTRCSWGCVDIDGKDFALPTWDGETKNPTWWDWDAMWVLARNLQTVLGVANVPAHIERTRNGYHVWVFPAEEVVSAPTMRRALMAACVALDYNPKEVNPKAEGVGKGFPVMYGNYVRLPYFGALSNPGGMERIFMADGCIEYGIEAFLDVAEAGKANTDKLEALAKLWTPPASSLQVDVEAGLHSDLEPILTRIDGLSFTIWRDGPLAGQDRSGTLAKLAYKLRDSDTPPEDALAVLLSADQRWGKFHDGKHDPVVELTKILERAYG